MYIARLVQLLRTFRAFGQSGTVFLEPLHTHAEEPWQAYLQLHQGEITSCYVQRKSDRQLLWKNTEALQWLETKESFSWSLEESSTVSPLSIFPPDNADQSEPESRIVHPANQMKPDQQEEDFLYDESFSYKQQEVPFVLMPQSQVPQRTNMQVNSSGPLSREHKRVFSLVDGHRTSTQIAMLLNFPAQRVVQILRELQAKRLVEL